MSLIKKSTDVINCFFSDTTTNISNLNNNTLLEINNILYATLKNRIVPESVLK